MEKVKFLVIFWGGKDGNGVELVSL